MQRVRRHLRIAPARELADLGVGVALCLESEGPDLLRLQRIEGLSAAHDTLTPGNPIVGPGTIGCDRLERVPIVEVAGTRWPWGPKEPLALTADAKGLPLRDRLHPPDQRIPLDRRRLGQQDLQGTLIGVLGIVRADRKAAGGAPENAIV